MCIKRYALCVAMQLKKLFNIFIPKINALSYPCPYRLFTHHRSFKDLDFHFSKLSLEILAYFEFIEKCVLLHFQAEHGKEAIHFHTLSTVLLLKRNNGSKLIRTVFWWVYHIDLLINSLCSHEYGKRNDFVFLTSCVPVPFDFYYNDYARVSISFYANMFISERVRVIALSLL